MSNKNKNKKTVDMHLGYLNGIDDPSSIYIIVSRDNDYQNIGKYWKNENNITINIQNNFIIKKVKF